MNMVEATLERSDGEFVAAAGGERIALGEEILAERPALKAYEGRKVVLGIRPEHLEDAELAPDRDESRCLRGEVVLREELGAEIMVHFKIDATPAHTEDVRELVQDIGDERAVQRAAEERRETLVVGRFGARTGVRIGERAAVAVDTRGLHFFDPDTGAGIYGELTERAGRTS